MDRKGNQDIRTEEPWDSKLEKYIDDICQAAEVNAKKHEEAGYHFKKRKSWFGLPTTVVPIIMSPVALILGSGSPYAVPISAVALLISGLSSGIYDFYDIGEQTQNNFNHSANFASLASDIRSEMIKTRQFRQAADVFIARIQMRYDNLAKVAPVLPKAVVKRVENELAEHKPLVTIMSRDIDIKN